MEPTEPNIYDKEGSKPATKADLLSQEKGRPRTGYNLGNSSSSSTSGGGARSTTKSSDGGARNSTSVGEPGLYNSSSTGDTPANLSAAENAPFKTSSLSSGAANATSSNGLTNFFLGSSRRKKSTVGGSLVGLLVGGGVFGLIIISGPAELVQLSHILQRTFNNSQNASSNRLDKLYRYATAEDVGETRLNVIERSIIRPQIESLNDLGISFDLNNLAGINGTTIDTNKLADNKYSALKDIPEAERGQWLSENTFSNVADAGGEFKHVGGGVYEIDDTNSSVSSLSFSKITATDSFGALENGKVTSALDFRIMSKWLGVPSLFHPLSRVASQQLQNAIDKAKDKQEAEKEAAETQEQDNQAAVADTPAAEDAANEIKSDEGGANFKTDVISSLAVFGGACFAKQVAGDINTVDKDRIALPAAVTAIHFVSEGEQIESGQDTSLNQIGADKVGLTDDKGQNVWSGKALQSLEGVDTSGKDISPDYKQAFSSSNTAKSMTDWSNGILSAFPIPGILGGPCGTLGTFIQVGGGIALSISSVIGEVGSFGALTPEIAAAWAAKEGSTFAETGVAMHLVKDLILNKTTDGKLAKDAFSGPGGGNLLAYGARYAADIGGAADGLVPLSGSNSTTLSYQQEQQSQKQFNSEGFFARIFDINDYRSLFGKLADTIKPSLVTNIGDTVGSSGNLFSDLASSMSSIFTPKSSAAPAPYDWGFPEVGLPSSLLNTTDPTLANPYINAEDVATLLNSTCLNSDGSVNTSCGYITKATTCFGEDIQQTQDDAGNNVWDVMPDSSPVDIDSDAYQAANCGDITTDPNWARIILFVVDTKNAQAAACYGGDDQSCQDIGATGSSSSSDSGSSPTSAGAGTSTATTSTAGATLDTSTLDEDSTSVACAANTTDIGIYTGYTQGSPVKIRLCAISNLPSSGSEANGGYGVTGADGKCPLNSRVSGAVYALVQAAQQDGVTLTTDSCFRTMAHQEALQGGAAVAAPPGYSNHQMGLAIDFSVPECDTTIAGQCSDPGNAMWDWLSKNAANFGYKSHVTSEAWHWSPTGD
jgi:hypothetical protein